MTSSDTLPLSEDQQELQETLRGFLAGQLPPATLRAALETRAGYGPELHARLASEFGLTGLTIPRKFLWENSCVDGLGRFSSSIMSSHAHWIFDMLATCDYNHGWPTPDSEDTSTSSNPTGEGPGELTAPTSSSHAEVVPHALNL